MALKQLVIRSKIKQLEKQLNDLRATDATFETRSAELKTREAELEAAVDEATDEISAEDQAVIDEKVKEFEADQAKLETEQAAHEDSKKNLEQEIQKLQAELAEIENRHEAPKPQQPKADEPAAKNERMTETMNRGFAHGMTMEQRRDYLAKPEVKDFYSRVRELIAQKRTITGSELLIPEITLELVKDNLHRYSKLIKYFRVKPLKGKARQRIAGAIPEGVWTEAIGKLNQLTLSFAQVELDGYKVGGYIPVPNSTLEDNDIGLANEIEDGLGQAIGLAVDKAGLYGTGVKMPLGIVTRLAQTSEPSSWGTDAPAWTDLHTTNLLSLNPASYSTGEAFFAALILKLGVAAPNYSNGGLFWAMNRKTHMTLLSKALAFNASAALVAGMNNTMPIVGGDIVELEFMSDYDIVGGFGSLYTLVERAGASLAVSDQVMFIEDQTVFKGTARYDGIPVFGEGFVGVNINNGSVTTTKTFPSDDANPQ